MPADPPPLSPDQRRRALEAWRDYEAAPAIGKFLGDRGDDRTPGDSYVAQQADRDRRRVDLIEDELAPLLAEFLTGRSDFADFKSRIDGAHKRRNLFGFSGMKGQMFFNMLYNAADRSAATASVGRSPTNCDSRCRRPPTTRTPSPRPRRCAALFVLADAAPSPGFCRTASGSTIRKVGICTGTGAA